MVLYRTDSNVISAHNWCHVGIIRHNDVTTLYVNNEIVELHSTEDNNVINEIGNDSTYIISVNGIVDDIRIHSNVVVDVDDIYNMSLSNTPNFLVRNLIGDWTFDNQLDMESDMYKDYSSTNANVISVNGSGLVNDIYKDGRTIDALSLASNNKQHAYVSGIKYINNDFEECSIWSRCKLGDSHNGFKPILSKPHVFKFGTSNNEIYFDLNNPIFNVFERLNNLLFKEFEVFDLYPKDDITFSNIEFINYQTLNVYLNGVDGDIYQNNFSNVNDDLTLTCRFKTHDINQHSSLILHDNAFELGIRDNALYLKTNMVNDRTPTRVYPPKNVYFTVTNDDYFNQLLHIHNDTYIIQTNTYLDDNSPANVFDDNSLTYWSANKNIYDTNNNDGSPNEFNMLYLQIIYPKSICIDYYELHGIDLPNKWILFGGDSVSNMTEIHRVVTNNNNLNDDAVYYYSSPKINGTGVAFRIYRLEFDMSYNTIHLTDWKIYGYENMIVSISEKKLLDMIHDNPNTFELLSQLKTHNAFDSVIYDNSETTGDITWTRNNNVFVTNSDTGKITIPTSALPVTNKSFSLVYAFKNIEVPTITLRDKNGTESVKLGWYQDKYTVLIGTEHYEIDPFVIDHSVFNKLSIVYNHIENVYQIYVNGVLHDDVNPTSRLQSVVSNIEIETVQSQVVTDIEITPFALSAEELNAMHIENTYVKLHLREINTISENELSLIDKIDVGPNILVEEYLMNGTNYDDNDGVVIITPANVSANREISLNINVLKNVIHTGSYLLTYEHYRGQMHLKITAFHANKAVLSFVLSNNIDDEDSLKKHIDLALINYDVWYSIKITTHNNVLSVFVNNLLFYITNTDNIWNTVSVESANLLNDSDTTTYTLFAKSANDRTEGVSGVQIDNFTLKLISHNNNIKLLDDINIHLSQEEDLLYKITIDNHDDSKEITNTSIYTYGGTYDLYNIKLPKLLPGTYDIPIMITFEDNTENKQEYYASYILRHTVLHEIKFEIVSTVLTDSKIKVSLYDLYVDAYIDMNDVELYIEYSLFSNFKDKKKILFNMNLSDNPLELIIENLLDNTLYYIRGTAWNHVTKEFAICSELVYSTTLNVEPVEYFVYSQINSWIFENGDTIVDKMFIQKSNANYMIIGNSDVLDNVRISIKKTSNTPNGNITDIIEYNKSDSHIKWTTDSTNDITSSEITISIWIQINSIYNDAHLFSIGDENMINGEEILINIVENKLRLYTKNSTEFVKTHVDYGNSTKNVVKLHKWHLITLTKDTSNNLHLYIDTERVIKCDLNMVIGDISKLVNCFYLYQNVNLIYNIWNIYYWDVFLSNNEIGYLCNNLLTKSYQVELKTYPSITFKSDDSLIVSDSEYDNGTYTITESSYTSVFKSYKLFDKNYKALHATNPDYMSSSGWISDLGLPQYFTITLPTNIYVLKYVLYPTQDNAGAHPKSWQMIGISENGTEHILDTRTDMEISINTLSNMNKYTFDVSLSESPYRTIQFKIIEVQEENYVSFAEFELWGKEYVTSNRLWDFSETPTTEGLTTIGNPNVMFDHEMLTFTTTETTLATIEDSCLSFELDLTHNLGDVFIDFTCFINSTILENEKITIFKFGELFDIDVQETYLAISDQNGKVIKISNYIGRRSFRLTILYKTATHMFNVYVNGTPCILEEVIDSEEPQVLDVYYDNAFKCKKMINSKIHHIKFGSISDMVSKTWFTHMYYSIGLGITDEHINTPNSNVDMNIYFTIEGVNVQNNGFDCTIKEIVITDHSKIDLLMCTLIISTDEYFSTNIIEKNVDLSVILDNVVNIDGLNPSTVYYVKANIIDGENTYTSTPILLVQTDRELTINEQYSIVNTNSNMLSTYIDDNAVYEIGQWGSIDTTFMLKSVIHESKYKNSLVINHTNFTADNDFTVVLYMNTININNEEPKLIYQMFYDAIKNQYDGDDCAHLTISINPTTNPISYDIKDSMMNSIDSIEHIVQSGIISDNDSINGNQHPTYTTNSFTLNNGDIIESTHLGRHLGRLFDKKGASIDGTTSDGYHDANNNGNMILTYTFTSGIKQVTGTKIHQSPWSWHLIGNVTVRYWDSSIGLFKDVANPSKTSFTNTYIGSYHAFTSEQDYINRGVEPYVFIEFDAIQTTKIQLELEIDFSNSIGNARYPGIDEWEIYGLKNDDNTHNTGSYKVAVVKESNRVHLYSGKNTEMMNLITSVEVENWYNEAYNIDNSITLYDVFKFAKIAKIDVKDVALSDKELNDISVAGIDTPITIYQQYWYASSNNIMSIADMQVLDESNNVIPITEWITNRGNLSSGTDITEYIDGNISPEKEWVFTDNGNGSILMQFKILKIPSKIVFSFTHLKEQKPMIIRWGVLEGYIGTGDGYEVAGSMDVVAELLPVSKRITPYLYRDNNSDEMQFYVNRRVEENILLSYNSSENNGLQTVTNTTNPVTLANGDIISETNPYHGDVPSNALTNVFSGIKAIDTSSTVLNDHQGGGDGDNTITYTFANNTKKTINRIKIYQAQMNYHLIGDFEIKCYDDVSSSYISVTNPSRTSFNHDASLNSSNKYYESSVGTVAEWFTSKGIEGFIEVNFDDFHTSSIQLEYKIWSESPHTAKYAKIDEWEIYGPDNKIPININDHLIVSSTYTGYKPEWIFDGITYYEPGGDIWMAEFQSNVIRTATIQYDFGEMKEITDILIWNHYWSHGRVDVYKIWLSDRLIDGVVSEDNMGMIYTNQFLKNILHVKLDSSNNVARYIKIKIERDTSILDDGSTIGIMEMRVYGDINLPENRVSMTLPSSYNHNWNTEDIPIEDRLETFYTTNINGIKYSVYSDNIDTTCEPHWVFASKWTTDVNYTNISELTTNTHGWFTVDNSMDANYYIKFSVPINVKSYYLTKNESNDEYFDVQVFVSNDGKTWSLINELHNVNTEMSGYVGAHKISIDDYEGFHTYMKLRFFNINTIVSQTDWKFDVLCLSEVLITPNYQYTNYRIHHEVNDDYYFASNNLKNVDPFEDKEMKLSVSMTSPTGYEPYKAFNGVVTNEGWYIDSSSGWIQLDLNKRRTITKIKIWNYRETTSYGFKKIAVYVSENEVSYTLSEVFLQETLISPAYMNDNVNIVDSPTNDPDVTINMQNYEKTRYVKIYVENDYGKIGIQEIQIFGNPLDNEVVYEPVIRTLSPSPYLNEDTGPSFQNIIEVSSYHSDRAPWYLFADNLGLGWLSATGVTESYFIYDFNHSITITSIKFKNYNSPNGTDTDVVKVWLGNDPSFSNESEYNLILDVIGRNGINQWESHVSYENRKYFGRYMKLNIHRNDNQPGLMNIEIYGFDNFKLVNVIDDVSNSKSINIILSPDYSTLSAGHSGNSTTMVHQGSFVTTSNDTRMGWHIFDGYVHSSVSDRNGFQSTMNDDYIIYDFGEQVIITHAIFWNYHNYPDIGNTDTVHMYIGDTETKIDTEIMYITGKRDMAQFIGDTSVMIPGRYVKIRFVNTSYNVGMTEVKLYGYKEQEKEDSYYTATGELKQLTPNGETINGIDGTNRSQEIYYQVDNIDSTTKEVNVKLDLSSYGFDVDNVIASSVYTQYHFGLYSNYNRRIGYLFDNNDASIGWASEYYSNLVGSHRVLSPDVTLDGYADEWVQIEFKSIKKINDIKFYDNYPEGSFEGYHQQYPGLNYTISTSTTTYEDLVNHTSYTNILVDNENTVDFSSENVYAKIIRITINRNGQQSMVGISELYVNGYDAVDESTIVPLSTYYSSLTTNTHSFKVPQGSRTYLKGSNLSPAGKTINMNNITLVFWSYRLNSQYPIQIQSADYVATDNTLRQYSVFFNDGAGTSGGRVGAGIGSFVNTNVTNGSLSDGEWHMWTIQITQNTSSTYLNCKLYLDDGANYQSGDYTYETTYIPYNGWNIDAIQIGGNYGNHVSSSAHKNGAQLDNVMLFKGQLSQAQIAQLYHGTRPDQLDLASQNATLHAHWTLNDTLEDTGPNGFTLEVVEFTDDTNKEYSFETNVPFTNYDTTKLKSIQHDSLPTIEQSDSFTALLKGHEIATNSMSASDISTGQLQYTRINHLFRTMYGGSSQKASIFFNSLTATSPLGTDNSDTKWVYLIYKFPTNTTVSNVTITMTDDGYSGHVFDHVFIQSSVDGASFIDIGTDAAKDGITHVSNSTVKLEFTATTAQYFKIWFHGIGTAYVSLSGIALYGPQDDGQNEPEVPTFLSVFTPVEPSLDNVEYEQVNVYGENAAKFTLTNGDFVYFVNFQPGYDMRNIFDNDDSTRTGMLPSNNLGNAYDNIYIYEPVEEIMISSIRYKFHYWGNVQIRLYDYDLTQETFTILDKVTLNFGGTTGTYVYNPTLIRNIIVGPNRPLKLIEHRFQGAGNTGTIYYMKFRSLQTTTLIDEMTMKSRRISPNPYLTIDNGQVIDYGTILDSSRLPWHLFNGTRNWPDSLAQNNEIGWLSSNNEPNGHINWLIYDLLQPYIITSMLFWNYDNVDYKTNILKVWVSNDPSVPETNNSLILDLRNLNTLEKWVATVEDTKRIPARYMRLYIEGDGVVVGLSEMEIYGIMDLNIEQPAWWMDASDASTITFDNDGNVASWRNKGTDTTITEIPVVNSSGGITHTGDSISFYDRKNAFGPFNSENIFFGDNLPNGFTCILKFRYIIESGGIFGNTAITPPNSAYAIGRWSSTYNNFDWDPWNWFIRLSKTFDNDIHTFVISVPYKTSGNYYTLDDVTVYWDGVKQGTDALNIYTLGVPYLSNTTSTAKTYIGTGHTNGVAYGSTAMFDGDIYQIMWYKKQMTDEEIEATLNFIDPPLNYNLITGRHIPLKNLYPFKVDINGSDYAYNYTNGEYCTITTSTAPNYNAYSPGNLITGYLTRYGGGHDYWYEQHTIAYVTFDFFTSKHIRKIEVWQVRDENSFSSWTSFAYDFDQIFIYASDDESLLPNERVIVESNPTLIYANKNAHYLHQSQITNSIELKPDVVANVDVKARYVRIFVKNTGGSGVGINEVKMYDVSEDSEVTTSSSKTVSRWDGLSLVAWDLETDSKPIFDESKLDYSSSVAANMNELIDKFTISRYNGNQLNYARVDNKNSAVIVTNDNSLIVGGNKSSTGTIIKQLLTQEDDQNIWKTGTDLSRSSSHSMSIWFYINEDVKKNSTLVSGYGSMLIEYLEFFYENSTDTLLPRFWWYAANNNYYKYNMNKPLATKTWYHYVVTINVVDGDKWNVKCYIDGELQDGYNIDNIVSIDHTSVNLPYPHYGVNEHPNRTDQYLTIGDRSYTYPYVNSYVRKLAFYDKVLSDSEIKSIYQSTMTSPTPTLTLKTHSMDSVTLYDQTHVGNGNTNSSYQQMWNTNVVLEPNTSYFISMKVSYSVANSIENHIQTILHLGQTSSGDRSTNTLFINSIHDSEASQRSLKNNYEYNANHSDMIKNKISLDGTNHIFNGTPHTVHSSQMHLGSYSYLEGWVPKNYATSYDVTYNIDGGYYEATFYRRIDVYDDIHDLKFSVCDSTFENVYDYVYFTHTAYNGGIPYIYVGIQTAWSGATPVNFKINRTWTFNRNSMSTAAWLFLHDMKNAVTTDGTPEFPTTIENSAYKIENSVLKIPAYVYNTGTDRSDDFKVDVSDMGLNTNDAFTISLWVKNMHPSQSATRQDILIMKTVEGKTYSLSHKRGVQHMYSSDGINTYHFGTSWEQVEIRLFSPVKTWQLLTVHVKNNLYTLYKDGVILSNFSSTMPISLGTIASISIFGRGLAHPDTTTNEIHVSDLRIYNSDLNDTQIGYLYTSGRFKYSNMDVHTLTYEALEPLPDSNNRLSIVDVQVFDENDNVLQVVEWNVDPVFAPAGNLDDLKRIITNGDDDGNLTYAIWDDSYTGGIGGLHGNGTWSEGDTLMEYNVIGGTPYKVKVMFAGPHHTGDPQYANDSYKKSFRIINGSQIATFYHSES